MTYKISRRTALKLVTAATVASGAACSSPKPNQRKSTKASSWKNTHDRTWLGGEYWANPMEDWRIAEGAADCSSDGGQRSVHSLTSSLETPLSGFEMSVIVSQTLVGKEVGGVGFRLGAKSEIEEYRSNLFVQAGYDCGILGSKLVLGSSEADLPGSDVSDVKLSLVGVAEGAEVRLTLTASDKSGQELASVDALAKPEDLIGNIAVVSNFKLGETQMGGGRYRFADWNMSGAAFSEHPERRFGPILWAMYTLNDTRSDDGFELKLSALTGPMGASDSHQVELQIQQGSDWKSLGFAPLDPDAWVATFKTPNWDEKVDTAYRLVYREQHKNGSETPDTFTGRIKANPSGRPMKMAALTCQNDYGFPYEPVALNVEKSQPDIVFFSGDQLYETHGGFGIIRTPADSAILNYLRKFYQFGWAFREVMRNAPTVCLPDDHDVFQGNLWGESGAPIENLEKDPSASVLGGYAQPVRMINAVHRSSLAHHPDAHDSAPVARDISVYYGELVYGNVGFAILADRQWKSGPERINVSVGVTGEGEEPTYYNPDFNPEGLDLLGERQEQFLKDWGEDWRGHSLKAVLSQTVFAGIATHQPRPDRYLKYDFDGSGWPSIARNRAVEIMRPSMALHICGDTHLGTLSQYGVDKQRDSNWAFCTPAISAGWPRWWLPDVVGLPHENRPDHGLDQTGEYLDAFGNKMYVYAAGNPELGTSGHRYKKAHQKGSGFGVVLFDTETRTYTMEAYRFLIDITDGKAENQFPGWPVTIRQEENKGENHLS